MTARNGAPGRSSRLLALALLIAGLAGGFAAFQTGARAFDGTGEHYTVVRHTLYAVPGGGIAIEEEETIEVSAQFVVNNHIWNTSSLPLPVRYNSAGALPGHDMPAIIQRAIGSWNGAGSAFTFAWAGGGSGNTGSCGNAIDTDGQNTIAFKSLPGLTLGRTCTIYPPGANSKLVEFDMEIDNEALLWSSSLPVPGDKYDLPTTILHELGHAAGLGHSADSSAVMYFQVAAGQNKRALTADDLAGIMAAYPAATSPSPTATNTPVPTNPPVSPSSPALPTVSIPTAVPTTVVPNVFQVRAPLLARD